MHAGIPYEKDSLKAKLCVQGKQLIYQICEENNLPYKRLGKLIVATKKSEIQKLEELLQKGNENGVTDLKILDNKEIKKLEPKIKAKAAIYSPSTGIVSVHHLMKYFIAKATANSGISPVLYNSKVVRTEKHSDGYKVTIRDPKGKEESFLTRILINSAGLFSDKISRMVGLDYKLYFCKGEYFSVSHRHHNKVNKLIYPLPTQISLGIHVVLDLANDIKLGPSAEYMKENIVDYTVNEKHKKKFYKSIRKFLPFLELKDLQPDQAGIRPKLFGKGMPIRDFVIQEDLPGLINLVGIESPGLTAAPAIGKYVAKMVNELSV